MDFVPGFWFYQTEDYIHLEETRARWNGKAP